MSSGRKGAAPAVLTNSALERGHANTHLRRPCRWRLGRGRRPRTGERQRGCLLLTLSLRGSWERVGNQTGMPLSRRRPEL